MASKAPSHGCHGEPGTAAVPEEKKKHLVGYRQASVPTAGGGVAAAAAAAHQQTMTQPPGATESELMMRGIGYTRGGNTVIVITVIVMKIIAMMTITVNDFLGFNGPARPSLSSLLQDGFLFRFCRNESGGSKSKNLISILVQICYFKFSKTHNRRKQVSFIFNPL